MKDKNGKELNVGDMVRVFERCETYLGVIRVMLESGSIYVAGIGVELKWTTWPKNVELAAKAGDDDEKKLLL